MGKLTGRIAVVTGASKGIGASIAEHLAAEGAAIIVNYASSRSDAEAVVARIVAQGGQAITVQADVSKQDEIGRLFSETKRIYGKLDILINNAGIYEYQPLGAITPQHFHKQFDLNVLGLLLTTQEAVKSMGTQGGSIVNVSSIVGRMPLPKASVYSATKAAVDAITVSLATELGPKRIRVNSINPGMVETEGLHSAGFAGGDFQRQIEASTPLGRIARPEDIATAAVFLALDDAGWVTGQTLILAGGARH
ncbi:MAG TPA: glucose 1-dehydrogenase [Acidisarcina sp.]|nr:glucose 1-dehydrogenase [Acidisarcina sp.]